MTSFARRAIRWGLYIGVSLVGIAYEMLYRESVRWPLIGGYLLVIGVIVYVLIQRAQYTTGDEEKAAD